MEESIKHIFDGNIQFHKELEQLKFDMVSKSVSKVDFET